LFPATEALKEQQRWVVANWVAAVESYRITMTAPVFNHAALVVFVVSGAAKAEPLRAVLASSGSTERYPARLIRPVDGELLWVVDRAAAARLSAAAAEN
jgi:6-phosphogluconolactonase